MGHLNTPPKRILFDIGHPAHVHLFRNAIRILQSRGNSVVITTRDKDVTTDLLSAYGFSYENVSTARKGTLGLAYEMLEHDFGVFKVAIRQRSQLLIGTSVSIAHVAPLVGAKSIVFNEDDASVAKSFVRLTYPLAHKIVTPAVLNEDHGEKHVTYNGVQKLAYLHPKYFTPNPKIKEKLGVEQNQTYFILRFVKLKAAHDVGEYGMGEDLQRKLVHFLEPHGKIFITSENSLPADLEKFRFTLNPAEIHHALNYASIFIGDSQSMAVEAAILGIPSLRINSFADRCSILQELQHKYQLICSFFPFQEEEIFRKLALWLGDKNLKIRWQKKRKKLLKEKIDLTTWMVDFIESII